VSVGSFISVMDSYQDVYGSFFDGHLAKNYRKISTANRTILTRYSLCE